MEIDELRRLLALATGSTAAPTPSQIAGSGPGVEGAAPPSGGSPADYPQYEGENDTPRIGADDDPARSGPTSLVTQESSMSDEVRALKQDFDRFWATKGNFQEESHEPLIDESSQASRFRHAGWQEIRRRVWASLQRTSQSSARRVAFGSCGSFSYLEQNNSNATEFRLRCNHCHDRLCTPCATARSARISRILLGLLPAGSNAVSFITLTLCGKDEPLSPLIDRLYKHFRALRLHPLWAEAVEAGAAFLEIKWSDKAQRWHPHLHIICVARYIDQAALSSVWRGITKDSFIVDISRVRDPQKTGQYVTKYASKPLNSSFSNTPRLLDEALLSLKGRRMCLTFGDWYGTPLTDAEDDELEQDDNRQWHFFTPLDALLDKANSGDRDSIRTLQLARLEGLWRQNNLATPPPTPH